MEMDKALADYCATGAPEPLQSFACNLQSFPQYVYIRKKGTRSISRHLVYLHEKKRISFALCKSEKSHSVYTIPIGKESALRLLPTVQSPNPARIFPSELLSCKTTPGIVLVTKSFVAAAKGKGSSTVALKEGDLLFPQEIKNKTKATAYLLAVTEKGREVTIDLKCTGRFSVSFGPQFDLLGVLVTFKSIIKLPLEVSICQRSTSEPDSLVSLQEIREELALCGVMTGELGTEQGMVQFRYKAELLTSLPYIAQKMVPRDPTSRTAMQLEADYDKAMRGQGESIYDEPSLAIYETVEVAMTSNPAYDSCGGGAAAIVSYVNTEHTPSEHEGSRKMVTIADINRRSASQDPEVISYSKKSSMMPLSEAPATGSVSGKHPHSSPVSQKVNTCTGPAPRDLSHTKVAVKLPIANTSLMKLPHEQHPEACVESKVAMTKDRNVAFLKSLDIDMVQRLLVGMNLSEHRERFFAEYVDGEILSSCDLQSLEELGVTSRIQQIRLTKLIDGTYSASTFLNK